MENREPTVRSQSFLGSTSFGLATNGVNVHFLSLRSVLSRHALSPETTTAALPDGFSIGVRTRLSASLATSPTGLGTALARKTFGWAGLKLMSKSAFQSLTPSFIRPA